MADESDYGPEFRALRVVHERRLAVYQTTTGGAGTGTVGNRDFTAGFFGSLHF
ncbi:hypothetical protein [Secundilactobacillus collinoides]|uniref:hypothetical protein n=1 Tax=Secundilactobacillus collinoides TaxID=33960 RepID=UPI0024366CA1|nr:hypothetical protein [Secundilactobacillus collinoides]